MLRGKWGEGVKRLEGAFKNKGQVSAFLNGQQCLPPRTNSPCLGEWCWGGIAASPSISIE